MYLPNGQPFQEPHPQEKWGYWVSLICFQIGTKLTSILSRKTPRTKNIDLVSTIQAPVVEHRSETDWLTAAVGMAQARDETWWHRDMLAGVVLPTAEVSCRGTFLLEIRRWKELVYKHWEGLGRCPPGSLVSCIGPLAEWWSTNTDHQHKTRWQSADTGAQIDALSVKHLISLCDRNRCCLHQTGIIPVSAPSCCRPALAWRCTGWLPSSLLGFPLGTCLMQMSGIRSSHGDKSCANLTFGAFKRTTLLQLALFWMQRKMLKALSQVSYHIRGIVSSAVQYCP